MPKKVSNAKIACLDFSLQKAKMKLGVQVLVENPEKLEAIRQRQDFNSHNILLHENLLPIIDDLQ